MTQSLYPMRAVCKLTNLTADTVRAWERRYSAICPGRVKGGRLYSQDEINRLKLLKRAVDAGHRIGRIAHLSNDDLTTLLKEFQDIREVPPATSYNAKVEEIFTSCKEYDFLKVDQELERQASLQSTKRFLQEIAVPLCERSEQEWMQGTITMGQKHMLFVLLRSLMGTLIRLRGNQLEPGTVMLFTTPMQGTYEFGSLIAAAMASEVGIYGLYLGPNLPDCEIVMAAKRTSVSGVVLWLSAGSGRDPHTVEVVQGIKRCLPKSCSVVVGGPIEPPIRDAMEALDIHCTPTYEDFEAYLQRR
ncbi:MerR family transcriptional regulator [Sulfidibacter corallicola]|uniref:MerR family transcriptional regulator n=1 Tax=Sulfidibacter corallicola TaxID=2818388 RepID=A0A8A4TLG7_SULCO|nr:MerR family transcriptional regulator [Sulfidibacter corallicola]QTD49731.1 MerR family transcriptional regulator [Sulfidibacter corallicola]